MSARRPQWVLFFSLLPVILGGEAASQAAPHDIAAVQAAIAEAKARLNLTPAQEAQLKPLIEERTTRLKSIRDKHAGDDSRRAKREMWWHPYTDGLVQIGRSMAILRGGGGFFARIKAFFSLLGGFAKRWRT